MGVLKHVKGVDQSVFWLLQRKFVHNTGEVDCPLCHIVKQLKVSRQNSCKAMEYLYRVEGVHHLHKLKWTVHKYLAREHIATT